VCVCVSMRLCMYVLYVRGYLVTTPYVFSKFTTDIKRGTSLRAPAVPPRKLPIWPKSPGFSPARSYLYTRTCAYLEVIPVYLEIIPVYTYVCLSQHISNTGVTH
jgi:hypothetical protein